MCVRACVRAPRPLTTSAPRHRAREAGARGAPSPRQRHHPRTALTATRGAGLMRALHCAAHRVLAALHLQARACHRQLRASALDRRRQLRGWGVGGGELRGGACWRALPRCVGVAWPSGATAAVKVGRQGRAAAGRFPNSGARPSPTAFPGPFPQPRTPHPGPRHGPAGSPAGRAGHPVVRCKSNQAPPTIASFRSCCLPTPIHFLSITSATASAGTGPSAGRADRGGGACVSVCRRVRAGGGMWGGGGRGHWRWRLGSNPAACE
jgi:hypothetical protein